MVDYISYEFEYLTYEISVPHRKLPGVCGSAVEDVEDPVDDDHDQVEAARADYQCYLRARCSRS